MLTNSPGVGVFSKMIRKGYLAKEPSLTASAGVAPNKFLAQIASDLGPAEEIGQVFIGFQKYVYQNQPVVR